MGDTRLFSEMSFIPHCFLENAEPLNPPGLALTPSHCSNLLRTTYSQQPGNSGLPHPQTCLPWALSTIVEDPSCAHWSLSHPAKTTETSGSTTYWSV